MSTGPRRGAQRGWLLLAALPVLVVVLAAPLVRAAGRPGSVTTAVVDVTETVAPLLAALSCGVHALRLSRRRRSRTGRGGTVRTDRRRPGATRDVAWGWALFAAACASWGAGQAAWTVDEVVLGRDAPVLSGADVGFLGFAALAPLAVVLVGRSSVRSLSRVRAVLDGMIVAGALFVLSWDTALGRVVTSAAASREALAVALAYPVGDLVIIAVAVMVVARTRTTLSVAVLVGGAVLMALSDSAYVYLSSSAEFSTGGLVDTGWTGAFVLLGAAALLADPVQQEVPPERRSTYLTGLVLPYVPFGVAGALVLVRLVQQEQDLPGLLALAVTGALVMGRQALVVLDNLRLSRQLSTRGEELHVMAYTDPLTGAGNRSAFTERLAELAESGAPVIAAMCDLDGFKAVNDVCGHAVGDAVLVAVARRLAEVTRPGDVVARLGGDEFGVVLSAADDDRTAQLLRERLATALSVPFDLPAGIPATAAEHVVAQVVNRVSVSVGVVSSAESGQVGAERLLQIADARMYAMKRGRGATELRDAQNRM